MKSPVRTVLALALAVSAVSLSSTTSAQTGWRARGLGGASGPVAPVSRYVTFITGEFMGADVVFEVVFNPRVPWSAQISIPIVDPRGIHLDGIDFVPGGPALVVGSPDKKISAYDIPSGGLLPDFVPDTDAIAVPPATPGTWPSSILSTPTHVYYTENQFGFGATSSDRIIRKPFVGGPEEVVYDGAVHGLVNFEGLEIFGGRLWFFCEDPGMPDDRALVSIGLAGGVWDGVGFGLHLTGLVEAPGPGTDGSDELDYDPYTGLLFGTNIINGEVVAFDPLAGIEITSPGSAHFIDGASILASLGELALLGGSIDGIRSSNDGMLVVSGKAGVMLAIDIEGVLIDGPDDGDIVPLFIASAGMLSMDDLTPLIELR